jgi:hypothetical protein
MSVAGPNVAAGTSYLAKRIARAGGDVQQGVSAETSAATTSLPLENSSETAAQMYPLFLRRPAHHGIKNGIKFFDWPWLYEESHPRREGVDIDDLWIRQPGHEQNGYVGS